MLTKAVESYIAVRRATGFAFRSKGSLLQSFAAFSEAAGKHYVCCGNRHPMGWIGAIAVYARSQAWPGDPICAVHPCGRPTPRNAASSLRQ